MWCKFSFFPPQFHIDGSDARKYEYYDSDQPIDPLVRVVLLENIARTLLLDASKYLNVRLLCSQMVVPSWKILALFWHPNVILASTAIVPLIRLCSLNEARITVFHDIVGILPFGIVYGSSCIFGVKCGNQLDHSGVECRYSWRTSVVDIGWLSPYDS